MRFSSERQCKNGKLADIKEIAPHFKFKFATKYKKSQVDSTYTVLFRSNFSKHFYFYKYTLFWVKKVVVKFKKEIKIAFEIYPSLQENYIN